jgi:parvulin-like peptidyl-prolyl isomerase
LKGLKVGQVSGLIQMGPSFTIIRVEAHLPAGATSYQEVKGKLREEQQKVRFEQYRSALNQKLKKNAKVEIL